jgi:hypothetical protein
MAGGMRITHLRNRARAEHIDDSTEDLTVPERFAERSDERLSDLLLDPCGRLLDLHGVLLRLDLRVEVGIDR